MCTIKETRAQQKVLKKVPVKIGNPNYIYYNKVVLFEHECTRWFPMLNFAVPNCMRG